MATGQFGTINTNYAEFEADGTLQLHGTATAWEDLRFPATAINPAGAPTAMTFDTARIGFLSAASGTQSIAVIAQMPHAWKLGSTIYPHIHWMPTNDDTGNVLWEMKYRWVNINADEGVGWTNSVVLAAGSGTAYRHQIISFDPISGSEKTLSSIISIVISRLGDGITGYVDDYDAPALLKEFDIHYEIDTLGSRLQLSK